MDNQDPLYQQTREINKLDTEGTGIEKLQKNPEKYILPGAAGIGNQLLFGVPEAVIKALGGKDKVKEIEKWKTENPGYAGGESVGTVASGFIPIVGAGGKAIQVAKAGEKGVKAIKSIIGGARGAESAMATNMAQGAAVGSGNATIGEGIREVAAGEVDPSKIGQMGLIGGVGGAIGGKIGKVKEQMPTPVKGAAKDMKKAAEAADAKLELYGGKEGYRQDLMNPKYSGTASKAKQAAMSDDWKINLVKTADDYGIKPNDLSSLDDARLANKAKLDELDAIAAPEVNQLQEKFLSDPEFAQKIADATTGNLPKKTIPGVSTSVENTVKDTVNNIASISDLGAMRKEINNTRAYYFKNLDTPGESGAVAESMIKALGIMKHELGDFASGVAEKAGRADLVRAPMDYGNIEALGSSMMKKNWKMSETGSNTGLNMAIANFLTGGNARALVAGAVGQTVSKGMAQKLMDIPRANKAAGFKGLLEKANKSAAVEAAPPTALGQINSAIGKPVQMAKEAVGAATTTPTLGPVAAGATSAYQTATEQPEEPAGAMVTGKSTDKKWQSQNPVAKESEALADSVEAGLERFWSTKYADFSRGAPSPDNPVYQDFRAKVMQQIADESGNINPGVVANILTKNPEERQQFVQAYSAYKSIFPNVSEAIKESHNPVSDVLGVIPGNVAQRGAITAAGSLGATQAARGALIGSMRAFAESAHAGNGASAQEETEKLLASKGKPEEVAAGLVGLMEKYDANKLATLRKYGIIK